MKALLIVDLQNDFLPGGALAVKGGDRVIKPVQTLMRLPFDFFVASQDWHPFNHCSFAETHGKKVGEHVALEGGDQILWPRHCVQGSRGANFSFEIGNSTFEKVFMKGVDEKIDSYSAFFDNGHEKATGLGDYLKEKGVEDLWIAGLTTEYCVKSSALDAIRLGLKVHVVRDACCPINLDEEDEQQAITEMERAGVDVTTVEKVRSLLQDPNHDLA